MAYTTRELIIESYYLSGIVAREFQTVSGQQITDGLRLLNSYLAVKTAQLDLVPYFKQYNLTAVVGQETYFIPNLLSIETVTFLLGTVRYPMASQSRREYFGDARVNGVNSLPFNWRAERKLGGMNLYVYFFPSDTYPIEVWGKFGLSSVTLTENLETGYDDFYIEYLRYGLASYICDENNKPFAPNKSGRLSELETLLRSISPPDLSVNYKTSFTNYGNGNWAVVNLSYGWTI